MKLFSIPERRLVLLHELPLPQFGNKNSSLVPMVDAIKSDFKAAEGHGFVGIHTTLNPPKDSDKAKISRVVQSPFPKIIFIQGNDEGYIEWYLQSTPANQSSFAILVTSTNDNPEPVPGGWDNGIAALASLGLSSVHLFGYEGQTLPFDLWNAWYVRRRNAEETRIHSVILDFLQERPELKQEPILYAGCVLGAYLAFLERRKQFMFDIRIDHELLNPGHTEEWDTAVRAVLSRRG